MGDLAVWGYQNFKKLGNFLPVIIDRRNRLALISSRGEDGTLGRVMHRRAGEKACGATFVCIQSCRPPNWAATSRSCVRKQQQVGQPYRASAALAPYQACCIGSTCARHFPPIVQARVTDCFCGLGDIGKSAGPASSCSPYSPGCN